MILAYALFRACSDRCHSGTGAPIAGVQVWPVWVHRAIEFGPRPDLVTRATLAVGSRVERLAGHVAVVPAESPLKPFSRRQTMIDGL